MSRRAVGASLGIVAAIAVWLLLQGWPRAPQPTSSSPNGEGNEEPFEEAPDSEADRRIHSRSAATYVGPSAGYLSLLQPKAPAYDKPQDAGVAGRRVSLSTRASGAGGVGHPTVSSRPACASASPLHPLGLSATRLHPPLLRGVASQRGDGPRRRRQQHRSPQ